MTKSQVSHLAINLHHHTCPVVVSSPPLSPYTSPLPLTCLPPAPRAPQVGLQCVHKGMIQCRGNAEDVQDCVVLVQLPAYRDATPCALTQGGRYMFYLQVCGGEGGD